MYLKLKELRQEYGITQQELAQAINTSNKNIWAYENRKAFPPPEILIALANFFEITIDELLERNKFTPEEKAAGASPTRRVNITPIEDDMLFQFREVGKRRGVDAQRGIIDMIEKML